MLAFLRRRFGDMATVARLLRSAERHALAGQQTKPGAEHFVLAALDLPDGTARQAFSAIGADPAGVAQAIETQHKAALAGIGIAPEEADEPPLPGQTGVYRAAPSGEALMQSLAKRSHAGRPLRGADVLVVAAGQPHGVVARTFKTMGIDPQALAAAAERAAG